MAGMFPKPATGQAKPLDPTRHQSGEYESAMSRMSDLQERVTRSSQNYNDSLQKTSGLYERLAQATSNLNDKLAAQVGVISRLGNALVDMVRKVAGAVDQSRRSVGAGGGQRGGSSQGQYFGVQPFPTYVHSPVSSVTRELVEITNKTLDVRIVGSTPLHTVTTLVTGKDMYRAARRAYGQDIADTLRPGFTKTAMAHGFANAELIDQSDPVPGTGPGGKNKKKPALDWNDLAQRTRTVTSGLGGIDLTNPDAGKSITALGTAITAIPHPAALAAGALTSLVGEAISKLGEEGRKQKTLVVGAFTEMTRGAKSFAQVSHELVHNTLSEGVRRAAEAGTSGDFLRSSSQWVGRQVAGALDVFGGPNLANFEVGTSVQNATRNLTHLQRLQNNQGWRALNRVSAAFAGRANLEGMADSTGAAGFGAGHGSFVFGLGGTSQQANDAAQRGNFVEGLARATGRSRQWVSASMGGELSRWAVEQESVRAGNFARQAQERNQLPSEIAERRVRGLNESAASGRLNPTQQNREAASIFRELVDSLGPLSLTAPTLLQGTQAAMSAGRLSDLDATRNDPLAMLVRLQTEQGIREARIEEYNRQMADALRAFRGTQNQIWGWFGGGF